MRRAGFRSSGRGGRSPGNDTPRFCGLLRDGVKGDAQQVVHHLKTAGLHHEGDHVRHSPVREADLIGRAAVRRMSEEALYSAGGEVAPVYPAHQPASRGKLGRRGGELARAACHGRGHGRRMGSP